MAAAEGYCSSGDHQARVVVGVAHIQYASPLAIMPLTCGVGDRDGDHVVLIVKRGAVVSRELCNLSRII